MKGDTVFHQVWHPPHDCLQKLDYQRPLTTLPRFKRAAMTREYLVELDNQIRGKQQAHKRKAAVECFIERNELNELADDISRERLQQLSDKNLRQEKYSHSLASQASLSKPSSLPALVQDAPVFGVNDPGNDPVVQAERRRKAHELYHEHLATEAQHKRQALREHMKNTKDERELLKFYRNTLHNDRANRYEQHLHTRTQLDKEWQRALAFKKSRELEERRLFQAPDVLLLDQGKRWRHCSRCKRHRDDTGSSKIWMESRYTAGSAHML